MTTQYAHMFNTDAVHFSEYFEFCLLDSMVMAPIDTEGQPQPALGPAERISGDESAASPAVLVLGAAHISTTT